METSTSLFHDLRRQKKDGTYPIKLCVIFNRKNKLYKTGVNVTQDDWQKINSERPRGELKDLRIKCGIILKEADTIIKNLPEFSFPSFEKQFLGPCVSHNVYQRLQNYCDKLTEEGRIGTAHTYKSTLISLRKFKTVLQFQEISPEFLQSYEGWMLKNGSSITTIGIYLRSLRTLVNLAIEEGILKSDQYPFGKRKYQIPTGRNLKKALPMSEIQKIFEYEAIPGSPDDKSKDFWIFTYLCNGLNVKDIARLRWKDIDGDKLVFSRAKTERTSRSNPKQIVAILPKEAHVVIKKWGNREGGAEDYVFPVLSRGLNPSQEYLCIYNFTRMLNKGMKRIGKEIGLALNLTTYTARHSFSTVLKRSGASVEFIAEALGHNNTATTQNYLDGFEDSMKKEFSLKLTAFAKAKKSKKSASQK